MIDQRIWKLSAATACARTVGDWLPLLTSAISGATQPSAAPPTNIPAAPPKCAIRAQVLSSGLAYPGGAGPGGGGGRQGGGEGMRGELGGRGSSREQGGGG